MSKTALTDVEANGAPPGPLKGSLSSSSPPPKPSKGPLTSIAETTPTERVAATVAAASVGTSVAAMVIEQSAVVLIAGVLSCAVGPYMYYQQTRLTDVRALKETHQAVAREVDLLRGENERLRRTVEELGESVRRLEDVEQALDALTHTQNQSISAFADQVRQSREILDRMKVSHRNEVLQNIIEVVIRSDRNRNSIIDDHEVEDLLDRIRHINGVVVEEDRFREAIDKCGRRLHAVMDIIKDLMSEEGDREDAMFHITE